MIKAINIVGAIKRWSHGEPLFGESEEVKKVKELEIVVEVLRGRMRKGVEKLERQVVERDRVLVIFENGRLGGCFRRFGGRLRVSGVVHHPQTTLQAHPGWLSIQDEG